MTSLGLVGIADKGTYSAEATYNKGQFVLYDGSTWLALKDNLNGVTPAEGENWKYLARGFAAELLSLVTAIDSQGLSGSQGGQVNAQSLIDVLADKVANQLIAKSMMSNVQVNDAEKVPTSALAYAMQQSIETLNSNLGTINAITLKTGTFPASGFTADNLGSFSIASGTYIIVCNLTGSLSDSTATGVVGLQCGEYKVRQSALADFDVDIELLSICKTTSSQSLNIYFLHHKTFRVEAAKCYIIKIK